jgi:hypothetical protein
LLGDATSLNLSMSEEETSQNNSFIKQTTEKQVAHDHWKYSLLVLILVVLFPIIIYFVKINRLTILFLLK